MNYCPHCGTTLTDSAASSCPEKDMERCPLITGVPYPPEACRQPAPPKHRKAPPRSKAVKKPIQKKRRKPVPPPKEDKRLKKKPKKITEPKAEVVNEPVTIHEDGYDGYYDDVIPADNGHERDKLDTEVIKRVALIGIGAALLVGLAVLMMYFI